MPRSHIAFVARLRRTLIGGVVGIGLLNLVTNRDIMENVENLVQGKPVPNAAAKRIEEQIAVHPEDMALRVEALKYYDTSQFTNRWSKQRVETLFSSTGVW